MRIVFFGTPDFAVATLSNLVKNNFEIVAVVTAPDKPSGRGQQLGTSAVKDFALEHKLPLLQPVNMKSEDFIRELQTYHADIQIVVAFRMMPEVVWNMPKLGTMNLHGSLLPQYRGAAPINWAIINGEKKTGVTTFLLKHEIDTGNILLQREVEISPEDDFGSMYEKLKNIGADLVVETLHKLIKNEINPIPQDQLIDININHAPKLTKELGKINVDSDVTYNHNLVRGLAPHPAAYFEFVDQSGKAQSIKIFKSSVEEIQTSQAGLVSDQKTTLKLACKNGFLHIHELQLQGKKRMRTEEFLRGFKI
jgi:methionyl-tRNA formyltransferase